LQNLIEQKIKIENKESKLCFVGVSLGESGTVETGIAIIDRKKNLLRVDKSYNLSELKTNLASIAPLESIVACVGMPRNMMMLNGKWRISSKNTKSFKLGNFESSKYSWTQRFSDRGSELCKTFQEEGMTVFRYNCDYTKNILQLNAPYRSRSPAACKYLQMIIDKKLNISGLPSNLIPLPAMNAIIGAYTAWKMAIGEENIGYKQIGIHKNLPVVSVISI